MEYCDQQNCKFPVYMTIYYQDYMRKVCAHHFLLKAVFDRMLMFNPENDHTQEVIEKFGKMAKDVLRDGVLQWNEIFIEDMKKQGKIEYKGMIEDMVAENSGE